MNVQIEEGWKKALASEFEKDYFVRLTDFVRQEYKQTTVYPPGRLIFNAFNLCPFDKVKVVIIGQDPYHGPDRRMGCAFRSTMGYRFRLLCRIYSRRFMTIWALRCLRAGI